MKWHRCILGAFLKNQNSNEHNRIVPHSKILCSIYRDFIRFISLHRNLNTLQVITHLHVCEKIKLYLLKGYEIYSFKTRFMYLSLQLIERLLTAMGFTQ
jgi:hypothetical protein